MLRPVDFVFQKLKIFPSLFSIFTGAKSFENNPCIGDAFLNKKGLHLFRLQLASRLADRYRRSIHRRLSSELIDQYQKNGYILIRNFLKEDDFYSLRKEILDNKWIRQDMNQGGTVTRRVWLDARSLNASAKNLKAIIQSSNVKDMIRYVAGTGGEPIFSLQAIFSGHSPRGNDPQSDFHTDTFHSTAKAWFFLENVAEDKGPFSYIPGSHKLTKNRLNWEYRMSCSASKNSNKYHARGSFRPTPDDLKDMAYDQPKVFGVPANTLVIANTMGFHRRTPSQQASVRVELYASLRRNPFNIFPQLDILSVRFLQNRIGMIYCIAMTFGNRFLGTKLPWKNAGYGFLKNPPKKRSKRRP